MFLFNFKTVVKSLYIKWMTSFYEIGIVNLILLIELAEHFVT